MRALPNGSSESGMPRPSEASSNPIKAVAGMLRAHLQELLNYTTHPITNATSEGFNALLQNIKANARGIPNFASFRVRILFHCAKLDMLPA